MVRFSAVASAVAIAAVAAGCGGPNRFFSDTTVCAQLRAHGFEVEARPRGVDYSQLVPRGYRRPGPVPYLIHIYEQDPDYRPSESDDALQLPTEAQESEGQISERYWNVVLFAGPDTPRLLQLDRALETLDEASSTGDDQGCS